MIRDTIGHNNVKFETISASIQWKIKSGFILFETADTRALRDGSKEKYVRSIHIIIIIESEKRLNVKSHVAWTRIFRAHFV